MAAGSQPSQVNPSETQAPAAVCAWPPHPSHFCRRRDPCGPGVRTCRIQCAQLKKRDTPSMKT
eukprot:357579-Chlamydomonas_euryale.AAC.6